MTNEELKGWLVTYEMLVAGAPDAFNGVNGVRAVSAYSERATAFRKSGIAVTVLFPDVYLRNMHGFSARESDRLKAIAARLYCSGDNHD